LNSHSAGTAAQILVLSSKSECTKTHQTAERLVAKLTDETVLSLIKAGEKESLGCLFRRYAPSVRSIGQRILHNAAEADDLVQDVFLYIYRKCALYDPSKGSARGWLIQVAYTQAFMRRRKVNSDGFRSSEIRDGDQQSGPAEGNGADNDHPLETLFGWNGWKKVLDTLTECQQETYGYISTRAARSQRSLKSWANPTLTSGIIIIVHWRNCESMRMRTA
jgi:RNA polymerase sigma factor (sigma-70 family)